MILRQKIRLSVLMFLVFSVFVVGLVIFKRMVPQEEERLTVRQDIPSKLPKKIGIIRHLKILDPVVDGFKSEMKNLGFIDGKNVVYDIELASDSVKLLQIVQNYVQQEVDLIYAVDGVTARAALNETQRTGKTYIPIVFAYANNPVETALVQSFRSSENNMTGVAVDLTGITEKKLEFLKQIDPNIKKIGIFVNKFATREEKLLLTEIRFQAPKFSMEVVEYLINSPPGPAFTAELLKISQSIKIGEIDAYYHIPDSILSRMENLEITSAMERRLKVPTICPSEDDLLESGGLLSYGPDLFIVGMQAAEMAVTILSENRHPRDIPIQSPKKNFLVINLSIAEEIGISIPPELLDIADKLIK